MITSPSQLLDAYKMAVYEKNVDAFSDLYDPGVIVFDVWEKWDIQGLTAWKQMAIDWFKSLGSERVVVAFEEPEIRSSEELAVVTAFVSYSAVNASGETLRSLQNRYTAVLRRIGPEWKVVHEHTSAPIVHETLKALLRR
jgi:ketosteroid isomerase-like protein